MRIDPATVWSWAALTASALTHMLRRCLRMLRDRRRELALGIGRTAPLSLRCSAIVACIAALLAVAVGFGIPRIRLDNSLSQLFGSDTLSVQAL